MLRNATHRNATQFECYGDGMTSFAKYLLTPEQKKELVDKFGHADKVPASFSSELVKRNLGELNVVVGAVERMGESMRLLQTLIDFDGSQSEIFEIYGSGGKKKNVSKNKRGVSSAEVLELLMEDKEFWRKVAKPYFEYDQSISNFALQLHFKQVEGTY